MKKKSQDVMVIGFALFAMFFGAGNLIFPVYLGKISGSSYWQAIIGFVITATGLPFLGIIAGIKAGGSAEKVASKLDKGFAILIITALTLCIGPLFAIPRTAATTYEMSIKPFFSGINPIIFYSIYFLINIIFVMKPSKIIDIIGFVLTPVLLLTLFILIVKGIINPIAAPVSANSSHIFSKSLAEGYQTMDAMAALIFSSIIFSSAIQKGYKSEKEIIDVTKKSGFVAIGGLALVYGGLVYIGSQASGLIPGDIEKVELVIEVSKRILGNQGMLILAIAVSLACITTSIGLITTASQYFERLTNGKLKYGINVIWISFMSTLIAYLGVDKIIKLAGPVLDILYPIIIILIISTLLDKFVKDDRVVSGTVYTTFAITLVDTLNIFGLKKVTSYLPFASIGFCWVIPAVLVFIFLNVKYGMEMNQKLNPAER